MDLLDKEMGGTHLVGLCLDLPPICWMVLGSAILGTVLIPLLLQVGGCHSIRDHGPWVLLSEKEGSQGEKGQKRMVGCLPSTG